jgi:hypothetical protein
MTSFDSETLFLRHAASLRSLAVELREPAESVHLKGTPGSRLESAISTHPTIHSWTPMLAMTTLRKLFLAGTALAASAAMLCGQTFDSVAAFGGIQGASGFTYQRYNPTEETYTPLVWTGAHWQKDLTVTGEYPRITSTWQAPGADAGYGPEHVVRSWQATASGTVSILMHSSTGNQIRWNWLPGAVNSDGVRLEIRRNRMPIYSAMLPPTVAGIAFPALSIPINAGDSLHFHVDPLGNYGWDAIDFLPVITQTSGAGYVDPAITYDSASAFGGTTVPWYYLAAPQGQGLRFSPANPSPYIPMTWQGAAAQYWAWVSGGTVNWSRVWAMQQHPETTHDSVRAWVAPASGDVYLTSVGNIAMAYAQTAPADGAIVMIHHNNNLIWSKTLTANDTVGEALNRRVRVVVGDSITFRVSAGPAQIAYGDHVNLHVRLRLVPTEYSVNAFSGTSTGNWSYVARLKATGALVPMTYDATQKAWRHVAGTSIASVRSDTQEPSAVADAVRAWRAPVDCVAHLDGVTLARQAEAAVGGEDGVNVTVLRNSEVVLTERIESADQLGIDLTARVPMRAGDYLYVQVDDGGASNAVGDNIALSYAVTPYVNGSPRRLDGPTIDIYGSGTPQVLTLSQPALWSWGRIRVFASIDLNAGAMLRVHDAVLEFQNTQQREFNLNWKGGRMATSNAVCGGRLDEIANTWLHSNFELDNGSWQCTDTIMRYHYGILPGRVDPPQTTGSFRGTRVTRGPSCGELIMRGPGASKLVDSVFMANLGADVGGGAGGVYDFDLPTDRVIANRIFGAPGTGGTNVTVVPGSTYSLLVKNTLVPYWWMFPNGVSPALDQPTVEPRYTLRMLPTRPTGMLPNFNCVGMQGGYRLPSIDPAVMPTTVSVRMGNTTQEFSNTKVDVWGAYFNGIDTNVVMHGSRTGGSGSLAASHIGEFMAFAGRVQFRSSSPQQIDAISGATTMEIGGWWAGAPPVTAIMKRVKLGLPNHRGQINVRSGSTLVLEDCVLDNVDIYNLGGTIVKARSTLLPAAIVRAGTLTSDDSRYEAIYRWDFPVSRDGWENWDQNYANYHTQGFQEPWNVVGGALRLHYPPIPVGGWTPPGQAPSPSRPLFLPRIVAPINGSWPANGSPPTKLLGLNGKHCYLVLRVNPHVAATGTPLRLVISATDREGGWASWPQYERQVEILATPGWQTYVWDLNVGLGPVNDARVSPVLGVQPGWQPYSGRTNYLGIQFGTYAQNGTLQAPDWLELDYVVITDDYSQY